MSIVPLGVEVAGATVLVVGGGPVGARKARRFADAGAAVVVLSPDFADEPFGGEGTGAGDGEPSDDGRTADSGGSVEFVRVAPAADPEAAAVWLSRVDPLLVVCATDDEAVNEAFAAAAREAGVLRNRADVAESEGAGSVVVPATLEDGPVVVSVSTGGRSPALSAHLRDRIGDVVEGAGAMASLSGDIRMDLRERAVPPAVRREAVRAVVADRGVWKALRTGKTNARQVAEAVASAVVGGEGST